MTGYQEHKFSCDEFSRFHPLVNFTYFAFVLVFSMTLTHPISQIISLVCAVFCGISVCGLKGAVFCLKYSLPLMLITAIVNPAFSHAGLTILVYLPTGNPLTLESILYGISSGTMLASVL
ncbi:MAG: energy-coupling factor transporter transmembrane protein EcfT, partial [Ruminococcus sp.]|nr:energy-coupling factor transporter transmembrane protein EcfT [Ruminococcus sp.]